jgi:hypothetical protein
LCARLIFLPYPFLSRGQTIPEQVSPYLRDHQNAKLLGGTQHFSDTQIVGPSGSYDRLPAIRDTGRFLEKIQDFGYTHLVVFRFMRDCGEIHYVVLLETAAVILQQVYAKNLGNLHTPIFQLPWRESQRRMEPIE